jgi:NADH:ubiquinone oxidoreductase subunit 3 (subunit A)
VCFRRPAFKLSGRDYLKVSGIMHNSAMHDHSKERYYSCTTPRGLLRSFTYLISLVVLIDVLALLLLDFMVSFKELLGDGLTIAISILLIVATTYAIYVPLRNVLSMQ